MEYKEEDFLMLSGIQHYIFCKRQWALIHIEQQWQENVHTVVGELFHKKAHDRFSYEKRKNTIVTRGMPIHSRELGISGECDIVEFLEVDDGILLSGKMGFYKPFPVEYKKGSPKDTEADILQLAAQAMCLEEMFSIPVREGALFYGETRRRETVLIGDSLRDSVKKALYDMHHMFSRGYTPKVQQSKACNACSLKEVCLPRMGKKSSVKNYIDSRVYEDTV